MPRRVLLSGKGTGWYNSRQKETEKDRPPCQKGRSRRGHRCGLYFYPAEAFSPAPAGQMGAMREKSLRGAF
jgi:hypothetical protein